MNLPEEEIDPLREEIMEHMRTWEEWAAVGPMPMDLRSVYMIDDTDQEAYLEICPELWSEEDISELANWRKGTDLVTPQAAGAFPEPYEQSVRDKLYPWVVAREDVQGADMPFPTNFNTIKVRRTDGATYTLVTNRL